MTAAHHPPNARSDVDLRGFVYALEPLRRKRKWQFDRLMAELARAQRALAETDGVWASARRLHDDQAQAAADALRHRIDPALHRDALQRLAEGRARLDLLAGRHAAQRELRDRCRADCAAQQRHIDALARHQDDALASHADDQRRRIGAEQDREWIARVATGRCRADAEGKGAGGGAGGGKGSVAGQAVGNAIGVQQGFSWKQVALGAVGGAVAGGLAGSGVLPNTDSAVVNGAVRGALSSAVTQGVAAATGLQSSFNWRNVAASALSAGAAQGLNAALDYNPQVNFDLGKSLVSGIGGSIVGQAVRGGKVEASTLATDVFGNVLADSLARANGQQTQGVGPWSDSDYRNGSDIQSDNLGDEAYRQQRIGQMQAQAGSAAAAAYVPISDQGRTAYPAEAPQAMAGVDGSSYLPSMFPDPQVVASNLNGRVPTYLFDTDALASGVVQRNVFASALPAGPSLASVPQLSLVEQQRASGLPFYDSLVASDNPWQSASARVGRGLYNAGYDLAGLGPRFYALGTDADVRARAIMNGVNTIAHPIDTATGIYGAGASYFKNASLEQVGEDGIRFLAGAAVGGAGSKGFAVAGELVEGSAAASRVRIASLLGDKVPDIAEGASSLIGANRAVIDPRKLTEYALNPDHPVGSNKARVFESALGFNASNADDLLVQLRMGVMNNNPVAGKVDQFGSRFTVDIPVSGPNGAGVVRSGWIYKPGSVTPELTTIFVK